jgi:small subunit ribosomal protein S14
MVKGSILLKTEMKELYQVKNLTRCKRCGRSHSVLRGLKLCKTCIRDLAYRGQQSDTKVHCFHVHKNKKREGNTLPIAFSFI